MSKLNKRRSTGRVYGRKRWHQQRVSSESESVSEEEKEMTQDNDDAVESFRFTDKMNIDDIGDLFELIKDKIGSKLVTVLIYMTLRHFGINWIRCDDFLKKIGGLTTETANKWANIFVSGSFNEFISEGRGGKHIPSFYDVFPDIELSAKNYSVQRCATKAADFDAFELARYIDEQFYISTGIEKDSNDSLIRSVRSCRLDLRRWGARFESNSQRPYFEGHERQDVVQHRIQLLQHFLPRKNSYYLTSDDAQLKWQTPIVGSPTILIFHDESTFRSGEVSAKRWFYGDQAPFYSKGRGRSNMLSEFLVMHPSGPFFQLSQADYNKALRKYPELGETSDVDYIERSASASINVSSDAYFDNSTMLSQFERLFKLLQFKECFRNHKIEIIVDNARTHSARACHLSDFGKGFQRVVL